MPGAWTRKSEPIVTTAPQLWTYISSSEAAHCPKLIMTRVRCRNTVLHKYLQSSISTKLFVPIKFGTFRFTGCLGWGQFVVDASLDVNNTILGISKIESPKLPVSLGQVWVREDECSRCCWLASKQYQIHFWKFTTASIYATGWNMSALGWQN